MDMEDRARAGRTTNMLFMSVTLDVSKLTGWLNADANCRVATGTATCGVRGGEARDGGGASSVQGGTNGHGG